MNVLPIEPLPVNDILDRAAWRPASMEAQVERFAQMMQPQPQPQPAGPASAGAHGTPSVLSSFLGQQDALIQKTFKDMRTFAAQAPTMDFEQMTAHHMQLNWQLAMVHMQFSAGVYVAQSSKSGLQTLMKNQ